MAVASVSQAGGPSIFFTDFESGIPSAIDPQVAATTGVQGYNGLGYAGNQFAGSFLRSPTGNTVTLTLTDLPPHDSVSVHFLFAAIDSLDGTGVVPPEGDFFRVAIDGVELFRESFANATAGQIQSYDPPPGVELARRIDLGFTQGVYMLDSAYDLSLDPVFSDIPHSASSITITFEIEGPGIQSLEDESWAMDRLRVLTHSSCVADLNGDGSLNFFDVSAFLVAYQANNPIADINNDGQFNFFDVSAFLTAYNAGCP